LLDKEAIRDCLMRYCHGIDRCDEDLVRRVYWPGATDDHGMFSGPASDFCRCDYADAPQDGCNSAFPGEYMD
jgi:hypothetical protein